MLRPMTVGLTALALACTPGASRAQPAAGQEGGPPSPMRAMSEHRASLLAQCPPAAPRLPEADGAKLAIHVVEHGTAGPTVLVVHGGVQGGLGGGPSTFAGQEALGGQGWRLRIVERPGFGSSPSRGVDDMAADSVWIAAMLGDGANLVGYSWSGAEAPLAAARRPEAVRSLVLVEPALQQLLMGSPAVDADPVLKADAMRWGGLLMAARTPGEYALKFAHSLGAVETGSDAPRTAVAALDADPALAARYGCALLQARMAPTDVLRQAAETVARAQIPVLVITGGWSPFFDAVGDTAAKLTGGRHVIVRSSNHFVQLTNAVEFNTTVDAFMREADKTSLPPAPEVIR
jgi:pimeloyl-ACP methyl ester carboxylesterase